MGSAHSFTHNMQKKQIVQSVRSGFSNHAFIAQTFWKFCKMLCFSRQPVQPAVKPCVDSRDPDHFIAVWISKPSLKIRPAVKSSQRRCEVAQLYLLTIPNAGFSKFRYFWKAKRKGWSWNLWKIRMYDRDVRVALLWPLPEPVTGFSWCTPASAVSGTVTSSRPEANSKDLAELAGDTKRWVAECVPGSWLGGLAAPSPSPACSRAGSWSSNSCERSCPPASARAWQLHPSAGVKIKRFRSIRKMRSRPAFSWKARNKRSN